MASPSKEDMILNIILENSPLKHWHFEELVKESNMTRAALNKWIKRFRKEGLIKRVKEKGKFPYFSCGIDNPVYKSRKKHYALNHLYQSGLINHLMSLKKVKTAIIFGSIARGDWYKDSDIDIFIYGETRGMDKYKYELKLRRDIELHIFKSKQEIKKIKTGLIKNIVNGYIVKGSITDFAEVS
ncbi:MAG: nucleotidyltransferase domain-containing protein [Nanoarchaeota archaeon]|nr:nucleotidyltransferase domain-containing protein [Nanoarchaeota archaeon]